MRRADLKDTKVMQFVATNASDPYERQEQLAEALEALVSGEGEFGDLENETVISVVTALFVYVLVTAIDGPAEAARHDALSAFHDQLASHIELNPAG